MSDGSRLFPGDEPLERWDGMVCSVCGRSSTTDTPLRQRTWVLIEDETCPDCVRAANVAEDPDYQELSEIFTDAKTGVSRIECGCGTDLGFVSRPGVFRRGVEIPCPICETVHHVARVPRRRGSGGVEMWMTLPQRNPPNG